MFQRLTAVAALAAGVLALAGASGLAQPEKKADPAKAKKALQEVQDFIGLWNLEGTQKVKYEKQDGGKGLFSAVHAMGGSKDGESFAGGAKKPECIVSGGSANIPVTYMGKTYYVCCSGCRDEFNAEPAKYVKGK